MLPSDHCENTKIPDRYLPYLITDEKEKLVGFMRAIDSGIKDIICHDIEKEIEFFTVHQGKDGKDYTLDLFDGSEGTIKSISSIYVHEWRSGVIVLCLWMSWI